MLATIKLAFSGNLHYDLVQIVGIYFESPFHVAFLQ